MSLLLSSAGRAERVNPASYPPYKGYAPRKHDSS